MDHIISDDLGKTWNTADTCYLKEGIRNPQTAQLDGIYILHGRNAGWHGFVFYTSEDGHNWDEGTYLASVESGTGYYSNNIVLNDKNKGNRLLVQYSEAFGEQDCINVKHVWLTVEKKVSGKVTNC